MTVERFDTWRQRRALIALADSTDFLETAEGFAFVEQLGEFFVPTLLGLSRRMGFMLDGDEIVNTAIERLCANGGRVAEYVAGAEEEPWGYLATCLTQWVRALWGSRGTNLEGLAELIPARTSGFEDSELTPLDEVVARCFAILAPITPKEIHAPVYRLLGWLAANPIQRLSYEVHERQAAHRFCPELTIEQVTAVMTIAWGSRPRQAETSIMGALLLNPKFQVSSGGTHARALTFYKHAIRAGANGSRLLTDWTS